MPRSQCEKENVQLVQELAEVDGPFESPINLNFRELIKLELPALAWNKPDAVPKKMKITNTGHTVIISGKWKSERPYLTGGPLDGKYVFSQIHFHWGPDNCKGSEHQVSGESFPLEMHVAHFKTEYMTQEAALREKDGMVVIVYLFKLQEEPNNSLKKIINALPSIRQTNTSQQLENRSILGLCNPFTDDYFMYWGSVVTSTCAHILLWIVCREPFGISRQQMDEFRKLLDSSQHPIQRNSREPQPLHKRNVFHVNASRYLDEPMRPVKQIMGCFCDRSAVDPEGDDLRKSEGDGGCSCNSNSGPQEELEGRQDPDCNQQTGISRGNGMYMQQTVYYQHATIHSVPAMPSNFGDSNKDPEVGDKKSFPQNGRQVSQSCCFLSVEEQRSVREKRRSRERPKERRRKPIDSVTTLTNLIETLETLKVQTYNKLKEIESINHEIRGMKSSCENLQEKNWLRHVEKIMSRQKRLTIRSSQCCFSELKKLAKECNFDKLLEDKLITGAEDGKTLFLNTAKGTDSTFLCSNASGDKTEFIGGDTLGNRPFSFLNCERFSRKSQKLIRSFFEDIKESEETQANLEKNLIIKKFEKLSRSSEQSNVSSVNIQAGHMHITKKMMNMGRIRNQFFTEIPSEEKIISPSLTKLVPTGKKKKKKSRTFFKIKLGGFENEKPTTNQKVQRSLFSRSALTWFNNRFSTTNGNGPFISLRLRDIELKSGKASSKKSTQSLKTTSIKKVISDEHIHTEVSSYMSESFASEISDKQSRYSKQTNTKIRKVVHEIEKNSDSGRKSDLSLMKFMKDVDAHKFYVHMNQSRNMSSATSTDTERKTTKFRNRRSRKDLWEKGSSGTFCKEVSKKKNEKGENVKGASESEGEKRVSTSTDSSSTIRRRDQILSCQSSNSGLEKFKDVGGVAEMETQTVSSPRRKKLRLDGRSESDYFEQDSDRSESRTINIESYTVSYTENECQVDLKPRVGGQTTIRSRNKSLVRNDATPKLSEEKCDCSTDLDLVSLHENKIKSQTETEQGPTENMELQTVRDISVEVNIPLPTLVEDTLVKNIDLVNDTLSDNEASELSLSPRKSSDTMSESKDFLFDMTTKEEYWVSKFSGKENNPIRDLVTEEQTRDLVAVEGPTNGEESSRATDAERTPQLDITAESSEVYVATTFLSDESADGKKTQFDDTLKESEFRNLFTAEEIDNIVEVSRDASQNELSEFNDYDLQTDSNGIMIYNGEKEMHSRDSTPSVPSSDDEKHHDTSIAAVSSVANIHSQQKPFSADSLNSFKNNYDGKQRKRRQCIRNKSKLLVRKSNAMIRKLSKIGGSNLDFTNLTEEEQLKIISANVAKFIKHKLVEHKQFFDFGNSENVPFDIEQWSKTAELDMRKVADEPEGGGKWKKEAEEKEEQEQETMSEPAPPVVPVPASPPPPLPPPVEVEGTKEPEHPKMTVVESIALSPAGDTEKIDKSDLRRHTLDFVKLNKIMAGKYKRGTPQESTGTKIGSKKFVKKEQSKAPMKKIDSNESPKGEILNPKPGTAKQVPESLIGRGTRAPSVDSAKRITNLQKGGKSDIPVLQNREPFRSARVARVNGRSASVSPTAATAAPRAIPSPTLALQKPKPPKKRLIPTYTLTSYLPAPNEVIQYQQRELDKYLTRTNNVTDFFLDESKDKKYSGKKNQDISKKNLDYLIMLQKKINHEISANIENSMNYVQTLLSQDYNGTAIIEKAPVKSSLDVFEPGIEGIVLIEMNDQFDGSSSSSEFSEESGFYCIYQGRNRRENNGNMKREIIVKREESGDSGLVDSRLFEELKETDSNYSCEVSILVAPECENPSKTNDVSDVLKKYIYHLGGGEESESCYISSDALMTEDSIKPRHQLKKRRDRVFDLPTEMKRKLLDVLEDDVWGLTPPPTPEDGSERLTELEEELTPDDLTKNEDELENAEIISKISDMVKLYLNEYDRTRGSGGLDDEQPPETLP